MPYFMSYSRALLSQLLIKQRKNHWLVSCDYVDACVAGKNLKYLLLLTVQNVGTRHHCNLSLYYLQCISATLLQHVC